MRRPRRQIHQINVVPYIDVMLVLLVIFMVTAPFIAPGQVNLPSVAKAQPATELPLEVTVKSDGTFTVRDRARTEDDTPVSRERLAGAIAARLSRDPARPVVIAADKDVRYERVMEVMSVLQRNNVKRIGLLARPTP